MKKPIIKTMSAYHKGQQACKEGFTNEMYPFSWHLFKKLAWIAGWKSIWRNAAYNMEACPYRIKFLRTLYFQGII